jgi:uncharacterized membrane protein YjgN (DUF898 family)
MAVGLAHRAHGATFMNDTIPNPFSNPFELRPAPPPPGGAPVRISFSGRRGDFWSMVSRGALLELVTFGFYRFWLATSMRRHLWSNTSVNGDAAEYTGTAKELFIGFLFALAILAPVYLVYFLISLEAERLRAFASIPLGLFFYLFAQFAIYRARRYRLTRTIWRGVRFWMTGSGVSYAWRAGLWSLLIGLTIGLALPWARASLERYKMRHTAYGDLQGSFAATGGQLFRRGWWLWALTMLGLILLVALTAAVRELGSLLSIAFWVAAPFVYAAFKAIEWRWWIDGIRVGEVRFESDLSKGALIGLYWKVIGWSVLALAVWGAIMFGIVMSIGGGLTGQTLLLAGQRYWILALFGISYLAVALTIGAIVRLYLMRDMWQRVADSVIVHNLAAADNVVARGEAVSALGEGFANSLDVAGI